MAYDEGLLERIHEQLIDNPSLDEKKMFGGIGFLLNGNMTFGILKDDLIVRVGKASYEDCMKKPHTRVFDITGKVMTGWVTVAPTGYDDEETLNEWLQLGLSFAASLPPN